MPRLRLLLGILLMGLLTRNLAAEDEAVTRGFRELLAAEWEYTLREAPTFASHLGDKRYNDRWPDVSLAAIERRHQHQQEVLAKLAAIDTENLPPADRLNYLLFKKEIASDLEQYPFRWHLVAAQSARRHSGRKPARRRALFHQGQGLRRLDRPAASVPSLHGPDDRAAAGRRSREDRAAEGRDAAAAGADQEATCR